MSTTNGSANLIAAHPGNVSAVKSGVYSGRVLAPRATEIRDVEHDEPLTFGVDLVE